MNIPIILAATILSGSFTTAVFLRSMIPGNEQKQVVAALQIAVENQKRVAEYEVQQGDTLTAILGSFQISYDQALAVVDASKEVFDLTKIQTGKILKLVFVNEVFASVQYPLSSDTMVAVKKTNDTFVASTEPIPYQMTTTKATGTIVDSFFGAAESAGIEDRVTMELAEIFSSDIDFTADIRGGDAFSVIYERRTLDGKDAGAGKILAAKFTNDGATYAAFRYGDKFYDADGNSIARQFLKSPLSYARISSGFSYKRMNPVTKQVTPHRAIDYAADTGTPVIATADGKVAISGPKGGLGITVELIHGSYLTQYAHLSRIAKGIKIGATVVQGDVIGFVGSTGISTGPHLQYAMFKDGNPINPLKTDFSQGESIKESDMVAFGAFVSGLQSQLLLPT